VDGRFVLIELARQVRRETVQLLQAARPEELTFAPAGTSNHILWHAGHVLWLQDVLGVRLLTGQSELPPAWEGTFGMNGRPPHQTTEWPSRERLVELLQGQLLRLVTLLEEVPEARLSEPADLRRGPASVAARIVHGWHDEAKHSGEMYLLLKVQRKGQSST
jgi:hypothetical protein